MDNYFELALVARVDGTPVILARLRDHTMLRAALRRAIVAAERQARGGDSEWPNPDAFRDHDVVM